MTGEMTAMTASVKDKMHQVRTSSSCLCIPLLSVDIHFAHILSAIYTDMIYSYIAMFVFPQINPYVLFPFFN